MAEKNQVYRCEHCGLSVEVVEGGGGTLVCCGEDMVHVAENTTDAAQEKHVPVIEKVDGGYKVSVGSAEHPMVEGHYIQWIELLAGGQVYRQHLDPDDRPEAFFRVDADDVTARAMCNLHGLWKS